MKSATLPSFWENYRDLDFSIRQQARKAYRLWRQNPFHPSLRFKCINRAENIWSVRITLGYRAIGILEDDTVTWFWIGNHDSYQQFF
jgi:mRNA-degrading endonuclease RelE of RelBE toxin-antitoxin system